MRTDRWKSILLAVMVALFLAPQIASANSPNITSLALTSGPVGIPLTITGSGFGASAGTVTFNGVNANVLSWSDGTVVVTIPATATTGNVVVTASGVNSNGVTYTVTALPSGWADEDIGSVGLAGSASYSGDVFTVKGSGLGVYYGMDQMHFAYQSLSGDGTIIARVVSITGSSSGTAGVMIRETSATGSTMAYTEHDAGSDLYCQYRPTTGASNSYSSASGKSLPYWVRLTRAGNTFTFYWGMDGVNWTQVGSAETVTMAQNVYVGLAASSGSNSSLATATFDNVSVIPGTTQSPSIASISATTGATGSSVTINGSGFGATQGSSMVTLSDTPLVITSWSSTSITATIPSGATSGAIVVAAAPSMNASNPATFTVTSNPLPNGWLDQDIGAVGSPGSGTFSNDAFTIQAYGNGVYYATDQLHFVYQPLTGDGSIVARVVSVSGSGVLGAVMIRETLSSGATLGATEHDYSSDVYFAYRTSTGASASSQGATGAAPPYWIALIRSGNTFISEMSSDGENWVEVGSTETLTMADSVYVGLAVSSGTTSSSGTVTFDHVSLSSNTVSSPFIGGISATTGPVGTPVTITGTGFGSSQSTSVVTVSGISASVSNWSDTSISFTIPSGATSGSIVVAVAPTMNSSNAMYFTITSQPLPSPWLDQDIGQLGARGSAAYSSGVFEVAAAGQGVYSTTDRIHFVYQPLIGDGTIVARVASFSGATYPQAGVMIRQTLESNSPMVFVSYESGSGYLWYRTTTGGSTSYQAATTGSLPYWAKLVRSGSSFTGYFSPDGFNWTQVGSTQTISMTQDVYVGLAVSSNSDPTLTTATIDNVELGTPANPSPIITMVSATTGNVGTQVTITGTGFGVTQGSSLATLNGSAVTINMWSNTSILITIPTGATTGALLVTVAPSMNDSNPVHFTVTSNPLPTGWLNQDIGRVGITGSGTYSGGVFTVEGSGTGPYSASDQMQFVYQPLQGDGSLVARVVSVSGGSYPNAGVMIRETLLTGATEEFVTYQAPSQMYVYDRTTTGSIPSYSATSSISLPYWVKVVRSGGTFSGYISSNGSTWTQVGSTVSITMAQNAYIGLGVTSQTNSTLATATFDNVSFSPGATPNVTALSPYTGGVGTTVTITGTDFGSSQGSSTVSFNGVNATSITSWGSTSIVAVVPNGVPGGAGPVVVTVGSSPSNATVLFTAFDPLITEASPPAAPPFGLVTVNGSGFGAIQNSSTITFNGIAAPVQSWSDSSISTQVPASASTGPIVVTAGGYASPGFSFSVIEALSITGINPTSGNVGTAVVISGAGFGPSQSDSVVTFDSVPATVTAWGDTQITAVVPSGAATGPVTVAVAGTTAVGPSFEVSSSATLTDSLGHPSTYGSIVAGGKWYVNAAAGSGCSSCTMRGSIQYTYDTNGNVLTKTDELGHVTSYTYDTNQNMLTMSQQANSGYATTTYTYNSFGEPLTVTDPLGNTTTNTYDSHGNLLTVTTPSPGGSTGGSVTQFAYNSLGEMTQITDPLGRMTTLTYTSVGLINTITDPQSNVTTYAYDSRGNRTSVTDAMSNQTTFAYDSGNRLLTITYPNSTTTTFNYDYRGRRTSATDQNGKTTSYAYDAADRLMSVTDPNSNVTNYTYDTENNLLSIEDGNSHTTSFTYDAYGRVTEATFPSTYYEQYGYDAANNLTSKTDRKGQTISYVYDDLNRLTQKMYPDSTTIEYVYDLANKLLQVTDPTGTYGFAYDNMGRLVGSTTQYSSLSSTTYSNSYSYDANSNRVSMTDPEGGVTSYVYDTLNRLSSLMPPSAFGTGAFGFSYDALSRRTQMTRPNGVATNYTYDKLSRLLSVLHQVGSSTIDGSVYTVDTAGNRLTNANQLSGVSSSYTYDPLYELTQVTQGTTTTESYSYDPVGNRLSSLGVPSYSSNSSNELTASSSASYSYDANGSTTSKTISGSTTQYTWDYENRLISVVLPGAGGTVSFKYDPFGRRIEKISPTTTSIFAYDGTGIVETVNASGSPVARYTQGPIIDEPLAELRGTATDYYEADGLASVTSLTDTTGALAQTYTYDSWGNQTASSGSLTNFFRYTGREFDAETNLYYNRARYLDPSTGRFLSEDPKKTTAEFNFYRYGLNSPLNFTDPLGWASCADGHCADCPGGRWVSAAVTAEAYASARFAGGGGLGFFGVMICTSNPTFNVPFATACGFGNVGLSPRPPLTSPPAKPIGVGGGLGGAALTCTGIQCKENLAGTEGGWYAQVGPAYYFHEGGPGGSGSCSGVGVGFELGLGGGGFKCKTWTGPSIGGVQ